MDYCVDCGNKTNTLLSGIGYLCHDCRRRRKQEEVIEKSKTLEKCSDFKVWDSGDMSELFWIHLGRYVKEPNKESLYFMELAYRWACHDNHGIANSFRHALEWAGIDLLTEYQRFERGNDNAEEK